MGCAPHLAMCVGVGAFFKTERSVCDIQRRLLKPHAAKRLHEGFRAVGKGGYTEFHKDPKRGAWNPCIRKNKYKQR